MHAVNQRNFATVADAARAQERPATHGDIDPTTREQRALNALDGIRESLNALRSFTTAEQAFIDQELVEVSNVLDNALGRLADRFGG